MYNIQKHVLSM